MNATKTARLSVIKCYHADHGVSPDTMEWAVNAITPRPTGFFMVTLVLPEDHLDLQNNLYGPASGDSPVQGEVLVRDGDDAWRGATPFIDLPSRPTRLLTVIGIVADDGVTIYTAYGGPAAERVASDPSLADDPEGRAAAAAFWKVHALSLSARK